MSYGALFYLVNKIHPPQRARGEIILTNSFVQSQKAVSAHLTCKQILVFVFAEQFSSIYNTSIPDKHETLAQCCFNDGPPPHMYITVTTRYTLSYQRGRYGFATNIIIMCVIFQY